MSRIFVYLAVCRQLSLFKCRIDFRRKFWYPERKKHFDSACKKNNLRFSADARYAVAGDDAGVWVYDTADFAAVGKLTRESYDLYENGSFHTVSNDGTRVLYRGADGQVGIAEVS